MKCRICNQPLETIRTLYCQECQEEIELKDLEDLCKELGWIINESKDDPGLRQQCILGREDLKEINNMINAKRF